jgi:hypothetical protein
LIESVRLPDDHALLARAPLRTPPHLRRAALPKSCPERQEVLR